MNVSLEDDFKALSPDQQAAVLAAVHVEGEVYRLRRTSPLPENQLERALAGHRKNCFGVTTPAARLLIERTLRIQGVLGLGLVPAPPGAWDWSNLDGSAAA